MPVKRQFTNSIIPDTFITCHCSVKKISLPNFCLLFPIVKNIQILFLNPKHHNAMTFVTLLVFAFLTLPPPATPLSSLSYPSMQTSLLYGFQNF